MKVAEPRKIQNLKFKPNAVTTDFEIGIRERIRNVLPLCDSAFFYVEIYDSTMRYSII